MSEATDNRILAASAAILGYAIIIGFTDNFVRAIAAEASLWQFHAVRTVMVALILVVAVPLLRLDLRPRNPGAVIARSVLHGSALMIYFGCLGFLSVAQAAAGLFTAPIFVLLFSRLLFGHPLGPVRIIAVALGFAGVVMVLQPGGNSPLGWASLVAVGAGVLYALGNLATREWCAGETTETLSAGFFVALGVAGGLGLAVMGVLSPEAPPGAQGFLLRGWVWPSFDFYLWTGVQAVGSLVGVSLVVKGYQLAEASRVSIIEYIILPVSALWSFVLWGETIGALGLCGMAAIIVAGGMIAFRHR